MILAINTTQKAINQSNINALKQRNNQKAQITNNCTITNSNVSFTGFKGIRDIFKALFAPVAACGSAITGCAAEALYVENVVDKFTAGTVFAIGWAIAGLILGNMLKKELFHS